MAEQYTPKAGTANAFKVESKKEEWHADFQGKIQIPEDVIPGQTYYFGLTKKKKESDGEVFLKFALGKQVQTKAPESLGGGSANPVNAGFDDMSDDVPF